jgi:hypothetical protein
MGPRRPAKARVGRAFMAFCVAHPGTVVLPLLQQGGAELNVTHS